VYSLSIVIVDIFNLA